MLSIHLKFGSSSLKGLGGVRSVTEIFISKSADKQMDRYEISKYIDFWNWFHEKITIYFYVK